MGSLVLEVFVHIWLNAAYVVKASVSKCLNTWCRMEDKVNQSSVWGLEPASLSPDLLKGYSDHSQQIGATLGWFLLRHLNRTQVAFDGDFVLAIVLGEIAHHNICHYYSSGLMTPHARDIDLEKPEGWPRLQSCNAYSLSNSTGIPRETVRRKAAELVKRGWIKREKGGFLVTPEATRHFSADYNLQSLTDLLDTANALIAIMTGDGRKDKSSASIHQ